MTLQLGGYPLLDDQTLEAADIETGSLLVLSVATEEVQARWAQIQEEARKKFAEEEARKQAEAAADQDRQSRAVVNRINDKYL